MQTDKRVDRTNERYPFTLLHFKVTVLEERPVLVAVSQPLHRQHILPHPFHSWKPAPRQSQCYTACCKAACCRSCALKGSQAELSFAELVQSGKLMWWALPTSMGYTAAMLLVLINWASTMIATVLYWSSRQAFVPCLHLFR